MKLPLLVIALGAALLPIRPAGAADNALKPGTYRNTTVMEVSDSEGPITTIDEECLTAEVARDAYAMLLRAISDLSDMDECTQTNVKTASAKVSFDMRCKDVTGAVSVSRGAMTFGGDWYTAEITTQTGREVIKVKVDAKWLKAGCSRKD